MVILAEISVIEEDDPSIKIYNYLPSATKQLE